MVSELGRGEALKLSPLFPGEMGQYDVQTLNFWPSKKFLSIAAIETSQKKQPTLFHSVVSPKSLHNNDILSRGVW